MIFILNLAAPKYLQFGDQEHMYQRLPLRYVPASVIVWSCTDFRFTHCGPIGLMSSEVQINLRLL